MRGITGKARVAGVVGWPIAHSLSPVLHNAWIAAAGLDAGYVPFACGEHDFQRLVEGFRGGAVRGLNVTLPFKAQALALADCCDGAARGAGAANLLLFHADGSMEARNTDGHGLLWAFAQQGQAEALTAGPVVILGAGGAARGAAAALAEAGAPALRMVNRTLARAEMLADEFGGVAYGLDRVEAAFDGCAAIINATSAGLGDKPAVDWPLAAAPMGAVVMDMVYRPLVTPLLAAAAARGMRTVDGLGMLIGQARPSFEAFFGAPPPEAVDARAVLVEAMG